MIKKDIFLKSVIVSSLSFIILYSSVFSATDHIVINEVQISGGSATDEFVELFNPTGSEVDLSGWRLTRKNSGGTEANLVASLSGTLSPGGHFLVTHPDYDGVVTADLPYSAPSNSLVSNGTVLLYSDAGTTLVDKVGMGTSLDFEGSATTVNPAADGSVERTGDDTDDNANDFIEMEVADPQNAASSSATPSPSPTATATATASASPTPTETASPTPTETASPTPTASASATPSASPTSIPTTAPTPSPSPTPTPEPTSTPRVVATFGFASSRRVCTLSYRTLRIGFFTVQFPTIRCERVVG